MGFQDEQDYIMRMIKEVIRVLVTVALGKTYKQVELDEAKEKAQERIQELQQ